MQAKYVAIWKLSGANKLAKDKPSVMLASSPEPKAIATITADPEQYFFHIDRASALERQLVTGSFSVEEESSPEERLATEAASMSASRAKETGAGVYLVIEGIKDIPPKEIKVRRDAVGFAVCFDAIDKKQVEAFRPFVDATIFALALSHERKVDRQIKNVGEIAYLLDPDSEKPVYNSSVRGGNARFLLSVPLTEDLISAAGNRLPAIIADKPLGRSIELMNLSFDRETNSLQAFMAAWSSLEIFVNTHFKSTYEAHWFSVMESGTPVAGKRVFERLKEVMRDKYGLAVKFLIIAAVLDPDAATSDDQEFRRLKKIRDSLFHEQ